MRLPPIIIISLSCFILITTDAHAQNEKKGERVERGQRQGNFEQMMSRLDRNRDGKISKKEAPPRLADNFDKIDVNRDGTIDKTELLRMVRQMQNAGNAPRGKQNPEADGNKGDKKPGMVRDGRSGKLTIEMLLRADRNSDGRISKEEAPEKMRERFDMIDQSGDGFLDKKELEQVILRVNDMMTNGQRRDPYDEADSGPKFPKRPPRE